MSNLLTVLNGKNIIVPENIAKLLTECKSFKVFNTSEELADAATNGKENVQYEVQYDVPGKGNYTEAIVQRVKNGISANYTEAYMRRRDPDTMVIADNNPTDKKRFIDNRNFRLAEKTRPCGFLLFCRKRKYWLFRYCYCSCQCSILCIGFVDVAILYIYENPLPDIRLHLV